MPSDYLKIELKQFKARQSRQIQVYLAAFRFPANTWPLSASIQKQVRCEAGQSQGSWRVIGFRVYLFSANNGPSVPVLA